MNFYKRILWLALTCYCYVSVQGQNNGIQTDVIRSEYLTLEENSWSVIENGIDHVQSLKQIIKLYRQFVEDKMTSQQSVNDFIIFDRIYEWKELQQNLITLNSLFEAYRLMLSQYVEEFDNLALNDFAETVLFDKDWPVNQTLDQIENIMVRQGLYYKATLEASAQVCATRQSAQQVLYQLYSAISITELKGYAMMQFSWMLLKSLGKGNYSRESILMRERFTERTLKTQQLLKKVMERSDRHVWRCDPTHHVEHETYETVTRLLQGYIENEVDMNNDGTCRENCAAYQFAENMGCYKDMYCSKQPKCTGKLLNCQFVDADMWVCPAKQSSVRRYEYVEYENGRILGKKGSCVRGASKVDSWWRWLFWHCSYCFCVCDEQSSKSDRYFNLRESVSNVTSNRVVTGLRFRKFNRIIHLQIQEGELGPRGSINASTLQWKPMSDYKLLDRGIKNGVDYHTLTWDKRSIDLDDLIAPASHVVTGVRFRKVGTHLNFEIRITEADFISGVLLDPLTTSVWISNDNTVQSSEKRTQIILNRPDVPSNSRAKSQPDSTTNQYIDFTHTDMDADAAQTTVPYLDAQDVVSIPPCAISGAGIYHKGLNMYGGFVAPKLITYDYSPHIEIPQPTVADKNLYVVDKV